LNSCTSPSSSRKNSPVLASASFEPTLMRLSESSGFILSTAVFSATLPTNQLRMLSRQR